MECLFARPSDVKHVFCISGGSEGPATWLVAGSVSCERMSNNYPVLHARSPFDGAGAGGRRGQEASDRRISVLGPSFGSGPKGGFAACMMVVDGRGWSVVWSDALSWSWSWSWSLPQERQAQRPDRPKGKRTRQASRAAGPVVR